MSYPVYSTRFIAHSGVNTAATWSCPGGYRAVVKQIAAMHGAGSTGAITVSWTSGYLYYHSFQDTNESISFATMLVLYPGENLSVYHQAQGTYSTVSGYLLRDLEGRASYETDGLTLGGQLPATELDPAGPPSV